MIAPDVIDVQTIALTERLEYLEDLTERQARIIAQLLVDNKQLKKDIYSIRKLSKETIETLRNQIDEVNSHLALDIAYDRKRLSKLEHAPINPTQKQELRLSRLDKLIAGRHNQGITFSEIGKILELGSRSPDGRSTRRQRMTDFGKLLSQKPECYEIFPSKTQGGKMVRLVNDYYLHVLRELKKV
jgi:hypothetical protein